jgi:sulfite reductase alpha subunit-like flavoprotein
MFSFHVLARQERGVLNGWYHAWSREQPEKIYVQHRLREHGARVADLIVRGGGYFFVCGYERFTTAHGVFVILIASLDH